MMTRRSLGVLVGLALTACGGKGKTTAADGGPGVDAGPGTAAFVPVQSCDWRAAAGTCTDFATAADTELHKKMCAGFKGTFADTPCPKERLVGTCELEKDERKRYYEGDTQPTFTVQLAKENCESPHLKGKFTPP